MVKALRVGVVLLNVLLSFSSYGFEIFAVSEPSDLPEAVTIKTATEAFTHHYYVALRDGRIWLKRRADAPKVVLKPDDTNKEQLAYNDVPPGPWLLLPPDGQPHPGRELPIFKRPPVGRLVSITADGDNLIAIDEARRVHYVKLYDLENWLPRWGLPRGDHLDVSKDIKVVAISQRGEFNEYYEDIDGNRHPIGAGVTTFYGLRADGRMIQYADPWLNGGFGHYIDGPLRGKFIAENLSASASTLFVIDRSGRMFTRLIDYDTRGDNPAWPIIKYTYKRGDYPGDTVRVLPSEGWREQPTIRPEQGRITRRITILQTGKGNAERELRVQGLDNQGNSGYFKKKIFAAEWEFVADANAGQPDADELLDTLAKPREAPSFDHVFKGKVTSWGLSQNAWMEIEQFNPFSENHDVLIGVGADSVRLKLYTRRLDVDPTTSEGTLRGMLFVPEEVAKSATGAVAKILNEGLKGERQIDLWVEFSPAMVKLHSYFLTPTPFHWFRATLKRR